MTLDFSGGREPRLSWGISSANPSEFLGDIASDPSVANLLKPSCRPITFSTPGAEAQIKVNGEPIDDRRSPFCADELLNTTHCETCDSVPSHSTSGSPVEADCATSVLEGAPLRTNGWTISQRPQTLLQNGPLTMPTLQQVRTRSTMSSTYALSSSPLHPPPPLTYHSHSPHSLTTSPPTVSLSPHSLHRSNSTASSPATPIDTPTNETCSGTPLTTNSRTQPLASSPFIASRLPSSIAVNMLTQISSYDLVDTMVTLKSTSRDIILHGQMGVVKRVSTGDTASVHLLSTSSDIHVPCSSLEPVRPRQKDVVKVIGGTHCLGRIGTLMSIIGEYGIVKFMRGDNIAQIPLKNLGRYVPTRESGVKAVDYLMKSASSANSSQQQTSNSKEASESPFSSINSSTTTSFPFVALHYPGSAFPLLIPGTASQAGSYVSLPGGAILPSTITAVSNDITGGSGPYTTARIFPGMMSSFMFKPTHTDSHSSNGMGTRNDSSSNSGFTSSDRPTSAVPHNSLSILYPPVVVGGRTIKSDTTSPTEVSTTFSVDEGPSPSFSFVRQDSTERDSVQRMMASNSLPRPSPFNLTQLSSSRSRPSVIQSLSTPSGSDPKHPPHHKGLLQPSSAIEKAKAFMATAMGVCPPSRGGGVVSRSRASEGGGGGVASAMMRVHQDGRLMGDGRAPPPYSTVKLGPRVSGHDHHGRGNHEDRIREFIEKLVQSRRCYAYRRNSGEGCHDVKTSCIRISLVCPLSQKRMSYPCRGHSCRHHQCFDADAYVRYNIAQKVKKKLMKQPNGKSCIQTVANKKWQCPICHSTVVANQLYIDKDIYSAVNESSAQEVELGDDGLWRPVQKEEKKIEVIDLTDLDD